jgi:tetratricopeptide (TPR) repeat protein
MSEPRDGTFEEVLDMTIGKFLITAAVAALAFPAAAAVTVIGSSSARLCYEAAEARSIPSTNSIGRCDEALAGEPLTDYEIVATYVNRGILKLRRGQIDQAIADFDTAIARDPSEPEAYLNKGMATLKLPNGWEQAVPLFDTAIERQTRRPAIAYYGRGIAHELGGQVKAAYLDYRQASALEPNWRDPRNELARFTVRHP